jgi:2-polyprenyl-3-methyl-5-hydroxy-6-metoxy-1,4-benzoquinol methylase
MSATPPLSPDLKSTQLQNNEPEPLQAKATEEEVTGEAKQTPSDELSDNSEASERNESPPKAIQTQAQQDNSITNCPLCGSEELRLHLPGRFEETGDDAPQGASAFCCSSMGHGRHNDVLFCPRCQHGFLAPLPSSSELAQLYGAVDDQLYLEQAEGRRRTFERSLKLMEGRPSEQKTGSKRLFEIGSYCGLFLEQAQQRGYEVDGIEPSDWARQRCLERSGIELRSGLFEADFCELNPECAEAYDNVASWDVLEHVHDPLAFCRSANQLLKPDGTFWFSTVNIHSAFARACGRRWPWYMQMHLHYFTLGSLEHLLKHSGFSLEGHCNYRHVISCAYLGKKLKAISGLPFDRLMAKSQRLQNLYIPFSLGDIVMIKARKR